MSIISLNQGTQAHFMAEGRDVEASISLSGLSDVTITAVANNQSLQYNSATTLWENADIIASSIDGGTY